MNISLTPEQEAMVRDKVESGLYNNNSEVVREALRLLDQHDKREKLREAIAQAKASVARGDVRAWTPQRLDEIWRQADQAAAAGEKPNPDVCP